MIKLLPLAEPLIDLLSAPVFCAAAFTLLIVAVVDIKSSIGRKQSENTTHKGTK